MVALAGGVLWAGYEGSLARTWWCGQPRPTDRRPRALPAMAGGDDRRSSSADRAPPEPTCGPPTRPSGAPSRTCPSPIRSAWATKDRSPGGASAPRGNGRRSWMPAWSSPCAPSSRGTEGGYLGEDMVLVTDDGPELLTTLGHGRAGERSSMTAAAIVPPAGGTATQGVRPREIGMTMSYNPFDPTRSTTTRRSWPSCARRDPRRRGDARGVLRHAPRRRHRDQPRRASASRRRRSARSRRTPGRPTSCSSASRTLPGTRRCGRSSPRSSAHRGSGALEPLVDRVCAELVDAMAPGIGRPHRRPGPATAGGGDRRADRRTGGRIATSSTSTPTWWSPPSRSRIRTCSRPPSTAWRSSTSTSCEVIRARRQATDRPDDAMTALIEYRDEDGRGPLRREGAAAPHART